MDLGETKDALLARLRRATLPLLLGAALLLSGLSRHEAAQTLFEKTALPSRLTHGGATYERRGAPVPLPRRARIGRYQIEPLYAPLPAAPRHDEEKIFLFLPRQEGELFQPYERLSVP